MPDFNKGDFTQQGVAGHVNANIRLNEKRLVNIDLTSNEEAEGCTIAGTVTDLLNDKVYNIGSGGGAELRKGTITLVNNSSSDLTSLDYVDSIMIYDNGCLYTTQFGDGGQPVNPNTSIIVEGFINKIVIYPEGEGDPITGYLLGSIMNAGTPSNLNNCYIADSGAFESGIMVTDPTLDCSLTITIESPGGI